jgi:hypothetical protein
MNSNLWMSLSDEVGIYFLLEALCRRIWLKLLPMTVS